jgi:hypothetical protein
LHALGEIVRIAKYIQYVKSEKFQEDHWARYKNMFRECLYNTARYEAQRNAILAEARLDRERVLSGYYTKWDSIFATLERELLRHGSLDALTPADVGKRGLTLSGVNKLSEYVYMREYGRFSRRVLDAHEEARSHRSGRRGAQEEDEEFLRQLSYDVPLSRLEHDNASQWAEIKRLFRRGSLVRHPDKVPPADRDAATERFKKWNGDLDRFKGRHYPSMSSQWR